MAKNNELTKADLDASLAAFSAQMDGEFKKLRDELTEALRQMEKNLVTEFRRYTKE